MSELGQEQPVAQAPLWSPATPAHCSGRTRRYSRAKLPLGLGTKAMSRAMTLTPDSEILVQYSGWIRGVCE
jgi:hypothetical protein